MLRRIASETPRVPYSFEPSVSRQVVHAPVRAIAGPVEADMKVAIDPSALEPDLQGALKPGTQDPAPGGNRQALTVQVRRKTPFNRRPYVLGFVSLGGIAVASGALLWTSQRSSPSLRTESYRVQAREPGAVVLPLGSVHGPPPIQVSAPSPSGAIPADDSPGRTASSGQPPTQSSPSVRSTRGTGPMPTPSSPSATPALPLRPAANPSAPPVPSDIDRFIHPMTP